MDIHPDMSRISSNPSSSRPSNGFTGPTSLRNGGERSVPVSAAGFFSGADRNGSMAPAPAMYDLARSPPGGGPNKNTKHVPCKFFRQGACQAGNACPFSHSLDPTTHQAPCKYFMKGNCKFGAKCALAHYLPDGRRVNRGDLEAGMAMGGVSFSGRQQSRPEPMPFPNLDQQQYPNEYFQGPNYPFSDTDEPDAFHDRYNQYQSNPVDSALNSPPLSQFGSPPGDSMLPRSPMGNARTALNAPLPQSFDSNGISHIAKYGPLGASVPDKFGLRSPPSSSLTRQLGSPPEPGPFRGSQPGSNLRGASPLAASPQNNDESIGQRIMHSQKTSKPRMISASVPRSSLYPDWQDPLDNEADLLPNSLHEDILTPQEKFRRLSRPDQEGMNIPSGTSSKVGSPPAAGSPSRFSHLWAEQREKKAAESNGSSAFGHVGSPLQQSWMPTESSSVPRNPQVSGISQAMARMQLSRTESTESNGGRPNVVRQTSNPVTRIDRTISSPGLSAKRIDEEGEVFFQMDDDTRFPGSSPRLAPMHEKTNGEMSRQLSRGEDGGNRPAKPFYGFRP